MTMLLFFAFLSGMVTIFAPCIWPILPIILSATATGGRRKPLGITLGIMLSFGVLTLTISYVVRLFSFDPNVLRFVAVAVIGFLGLTLVVPSLSAKFETMISRLSGKIGGGISSVSDGFWPGFATGLSLGVIWTPCAGPVLAAVATLSATQSVSLNVVFVMMAYVVGVGVPLFFFATLGKSFFAKSRLFTKYTGQVQRIFGVIMILTAISIATNYDKALQVKLLDIFPSYGQFVLNFENNDIVKRQLDALKGSSSKVEKPVDMGKLFNARSKAPEFSQDGNWLNTDKPLTLSDLKGKVVLVDFWTYTCINCIRTLPYVTSWYDKYKDQGLVVIGVHTPEFEFEKSQKNVLDAIDRYNIHYPVLQDNGYATWNAYNNSYWPAEYLIDANGQIRRTHFGEGKYDEMEMAIQELLKEAGASVNTSLTVMPDETSKERISPETYLGSDRAQLYYPMKRLRNGQRKFSLEDTLPKNSVSLGGEWVVSDEYIRAVSNASLRYHFTANKVFLVLRPGEGDTPKRVRVLIDGKIADESVVGQDVRDGVVTIDSDRLYNLIDLRGKAEDHTLELQFEDVGTEAFAFTFG